MLHQFPEAGQLVRRLRDIACTDAACGWCRQRHDARKELTRWFGFPDFRPEPQDDDGTPMQRSIIEAAMGGEHVLGILPTGAGKSICYQIPALSRYDKTGALTVVISPLVALMADQVTGLEARGITSCVAINGLLSMPERADALDRGAPGRRRYSFDSTGAVAEHRPAQRTGAAGDRLLGHGRGPLPLQVGPRLPPRLLVRGPFHPGARPATVPCRRSCA